MYLGFKRLFQPFLRYVYFSGSKKANSFKQTKTAFLNIFNPKVFRKAFHNLNESWLVIETLNYTIFEET